jgi:hypothetical protein
MLSCDVMVKAKMFEYVRRAQSKTVVLILRGRGCIFMPNKVYPLIISPNRVLNRKQGQNIMPPRNITPE